MQTNPAEPGTGYEMPFRTETDTGYFKGYPAARLQRVEDTDSSMLGIFLSKLAGKKEIVLLDSQALSHTVFIDQHKKIRYDTLRNKQTLLISEYGFGDNYYQRVRLNDKIIRDYRFKETGEDEEDIFAFNGDSFRHFSFKGNTFYYIQGMIMDGYGGSVHTLNYHFIMQAGQNAFDILMTCRMAPQLFGDVNGDAYLDILDFDNADFCTVVPLSDEAVIRFHSFTAKGQLLLQKAKNGQPYFIEGNTGAGYMQDSFIVKKSFWPKSLQ